MTDPDQADEAPMSTAASLTVIAAEQRRVGRRVTFNPAYMNGAWAIAWFLGFGAAYLAYGRDRVIPAWLGPTVPIVLLVVATAATIAYSIRIGSGITGPSRMSAAMYGWSWMLGFACLDVVNLALARDGMPEKTVTLLWSASSLLLVGMMHLAGGALWRDTMLYATGVWTLLASAGAVLVGVPGNFLVLALAGGGGFAVLAAYTAWRRRI